ncbi:MAG: cation:proton antiporter, partial [Neisseriaceae bacterium]|nr:cation:proton antiporter [Neisseriaceae bacterium]
MTDILLYIFIYLIFAIGAVLLSQKFGLGSVLGYLMAGVMIGPVLGLVGEETQFIQHIAEFGVVMMLFLVGLELEPKKLWKLRRKLLGLGGLQVGLTLFIIAIIVHTFGYGWRVSITIGCILALSSTAIVLQTFNEKNLISSQGGQAGFAVLLFQDVAAIPMLALLPSLSTYSHKQESEYLLIEQSGWVVALVSVIVIAIVILGVRHLVPIIFRFIIKSRIREMFTAFMLALVVGVATIMSAIG